ncbi:hypothetical protein F5882DRAFT_435426 [Hyaloscypha sp. PMI_1271]|nr:hypothetical protein F5882DRAFT_435426 [Hyaloscypha sp. PMI_1271]
MSSSPAASQSGPTKEAMISASTVYRRINDKLKSGLVPRTADIEEYFRLFGDPIEHNSLCKNYKQNPDAKAQLDRIRERLDSTPMMAAPTAPKYHVPSTRSNSKRKASDNAEVKEPTLKKRGPGRPSAKKGSKKAKAEAKEEQEEVLQSFEEEIVEKTHHTAKQILNANNQPPHELHPRQIQLSRNWIDGSESFQGLLLGAHSAANLCTTLQTFVSRRGIHLSSAQRIGVESYREERRNGRFGYIGPPEDEETIARYYEFFNDIFFCGSLSGLCVVKFYRGVEQSGHGADGFDDLGLAITPVTGRTHRKEIPDGYAALIKIKDQANNSPLLSEEARLQCYLSTLLHEMLHVYFGVYECLCGEKCRERHADEIGINGHGKSWQFAALALEEATLPLLGESLDLSRRISFEYDALYMKTVDAETRARFRF